jgi:nicotinate dehydrogenase subunit A
MEQTFELVVNGRSYQVRTEPDTPLLYLLRNDLGLKAAKFGCGLEQCGACKVLVGGEPMLSCRTPIDALWGREVTTLEGLGTRESLHPIQRAFIDERAAQCGFCTAGVIVAAKAILDRSPEPSDREIREELMPHLCRCGAHGRMLRAIQRAAAALRA